MYYCKCGSVHNIYLELEYIDQNDCNDYIVSNFSIDSWLFVVVQEGNRPLCFKLASKDSLFMNARHVYWSWDSERGYEHNLRLTDPRFQTLPLVWNHIQRLIKLQAFT